jgi:hypothetical protein
LLKEANSCNQHITTYNVVTVEEAATMIKANTTMTTTIPSITTPIEGHFSQEPEDVL